MIQTEIFTNDDAQGSQDAINRFLGTIKEEQFISINCFSGPYCDGEDISPTSTVVILYRKD